MNRIMNLLVSVNNSYFRRYLFVLLPLLTVLICIYNVVYYLPEYPFNASENTVVLCGVVYIFILYCLSHRRDLFCMTALMTFFVWSIFSFIVTHVYTIISVLMIACIITIFIITILVRFSPRRYG